MTHGEYIEELKARLEKARKQRNERSLTIKELRKEISRLKTAIRTRDPEYFGDETGRH